MYSEMKDLIDREPDYSTLFRNIKAVTKNCVTMPFKHKDGVIKNLDKSKPPNTIEVDIFKPNGQDIDRGPDGF
jgi:predicted metal-dependent enzyme (double-stranded beta helix superfamily)